MFEIKAWDEESEKIFREISSFGRTRTKNSDLAIKFSRNPKIRELSSKDFFSITRNNRKNEHWFTTPKNVSVSPVFKKNRLVFRFKKLF